MIEYYPGAARPHWRCNHCHGIRRIKVRISRKDRDVYEEVKAFVLGLFENPEKYKYGFTKEELAVLFCVKNHNVEQALARLNREGLVNQPLHRIPHDCNRNPYDGGSDSSWFGDVYTVREHDHN